jgi:hypothetical protein
MRCGRTLRVRREEHKAVAKEWMGRVDDLDLGQIVLREGLWVVERGMNMCARSIISITTS